MEIECDFEVVENNQGLLCIWVEKLALTIPLIAQDWGKGTTGKMKFVVTNPECCTS